MTRKRWVLVALVGLVVVVLGGLVIAVLRGREPEKVTVEEAVEQYRTTSPSATELPVVDRPAPGVYSATGSGSEKLSFQTTEVPIGPTIPVTVTLEGDDCFVMRVDFNENHWQTWRFCNLEGGLADMGGEVFQRFDLVVMAPESHSTTTCDPPAMMVRPGMQPDDTWDQTCTIPSTEEGGEPSTSTGPALFVGEEVLTIAGERVATYHVRAQRTLSGTQEGTGSSDFWLDATTGLPVRMTWTLLVDSPSVIGTVTYTEDGTWTLDSLTPREA